MDKESIKCGNTEIEKHKFHHSNDPIFLNMI